MHFEFQKSLEIEDMVEEERKAYFDKIENVESSLRMFELKARNAQDHGKFMHFNMSQSVLYSLHCLLLLQAGHSLGRFCEKVFRFTQNLSVVIIQVLFIS